MVRFVPSGPAALALLATLFPTAALAARPVPVPVSEIVEDARGRVLFAADADRERSPASLAKMMTLLLAFDALRAGTLRLTAPLVMTAEGERQRPSRLGLRRGRSITVDAALHAIAVISANDLAVALADRLAGSEAHFVALMNRRAAQIGMTHTRFGNATGLAPGAGLTTARDLAVLARFIVAHYPGDYPVFATRTIRWDGRVRRNHNRLLGRVPGLDGLKTGYTVAAGFNLAASARRGPSRVLVVVLGARTAAARDLLVANLLEAGFSSPRTSPPATGRQARRYIASPRRSEHSARHSRA